LDQRKLLIFDLVLIYDPILASVTQSIERNFYYYTDIHIFITKRRVVQHECIRIKSLLSFGVLLLLFLSASFYQIW
jgi:hypothetical protein